MILKLLQEFERVQFVLKNIKKETTILYIL